MPHLNIFGGGGGGGGGGALAPLAHPVPPPLFRILDLSLAERFMCWRNLFGGWKRPLYSTLAPG